MKDSFLFWIARKFSNHIITPSYHAKSDLKKNFQIREEKISVIYQGPELRDQALLEETGVHLPQKFCLYVGGDDKRKNLDKFIEVFDCLPQFFLVLAGIIKDFVDRYKLDEKDNIIALSWVSEDELTFLYRRAYLFIYPSLYKGFRLQLVEAMNCDLPVICSSVTSLPEVLGNNNFTFDPNDENSIKNMIIKMFEDPVFYDEARTYVQERKKFFSWEKTAESTLKIYQFLMNSQRVLMRARVIFMIFTCNM